jgi:hypothetical protein
MTHPKLIDTFNCKSKNENNERIRNWGLLFFTYNTSRVEGRVGAPGWGLG